MKTLIKKSYNPQSYKQKLISQKNAKIQEFKEILSYHPNNQTLEYEDGTIYTGQLLQNTIREGYGILQVFDGSLYFGKWAQNTYHGSGVYIHQNGERYQGQLDYGCKAGYGKYFYENGTIYTGQWQGDLKFGNGEEITQDGYRYVGGWSDNDKDGEGVLYFNEKLIAKGLWGKGQFKQGEIKVGNYEGQWKNGNRNGKGQYLFQGGDKYEGEWVNGQKNGNGRYFFTNGDKYQGQLKNGLKSGKGQYKYYTGDSYQGEFRNNLKHGFGVMRFINGESYQGMWQRDMFNGPGQYKFPNNQAIKTNFVNGKPTSHIQPLIISTVNSALNSTYKKGMNSSTIQTNPYNKGSYIMSEMPKKSKFNYTSFNKKDLQY